MLSANQVAQELQALHNGAASDGEVSFRPLKHIICPRTGVRSIFDRFETYLSLDVHAYRKALLEGHY